MARVLSLPVIIVMVLAGVLCVALLTRCWFRRPPDNAPVSRTVPNLFKGVSLKGLPQDELRKLAAPFKSKKDHTISEFDTIVMDGETVLTQGYESAPGAFIFSTMTPEIAPQPDGSTKVRVRMNTVQFSVTGESKTIHNLDFTVAPDRSKNIFVLTEGQFHMLSLFAKPDASAPMAIRMRAVESAAKLSP